MADITVEVQGVGPVTISSTTDPEFKKTNTIAVDPADAYWFEELHNSDKCVVYYVTLRGEPAEETLSGYMTIATKIAPDVYVSPDDPVDVKVIDGYSLESRPMFKADGSKFKMGTDSPESIKYYVIRYVPTNN